MSQLDSRSARLHRLLYNQFLDELDKDIVKEIMNNPLGDEAQLLNQKVEAAIRAKTPIEVS